ncbi:MAG: SMP-30/gluconolactonase/LRE family protein [Phycisphaerales bacterium]|nr:MAG: SMP-30/gluconolactonase/LRE family protein [Phycisphaerales bacterium]
MVLVSAVLGQTTGVTHSDTFTGGTDHPARLAPAPGGGVYVTDTPGGQVVEYDAAGAVANVYAIAESPVGIAVHPDGRVFISRLDGAVGIYDASFVSLGTVDPTPFTMTAPNDIAIDSTNGEVYVTDSEEHRILVFDGATGALARVWGSQGSGLAEFQSPQAIAIDSALGHVIVSDVDNFRVQVFDTAGLLQFKFGYRTLYVGGTEQAWFARAEGLAVDSCSNIYVTDALMGTVRAFSSTGSELDPTFQPLIHYGTGPGEVRLPCDVAIDGSGRLFVASQNNSAIEVYDVVCTTGGLRGIGMVGDPSRLSAQADDVLLHPGRAARGAPASIGRALADGSSPRRAGVSGVRGVNVENVVVSVDGVGVGSIGDLLERDGLSLAGATRGALEPPHMVDIRYTCGRCHDMDGDPAGGMLDVQGQENLCRSCHMAGGRAMSTMMGDGSDGNTHNWGMSATAGGVAGPEAGSEIALHLDGTSVRCGTCHEPHNNDAGTPFLRRDTRGAQLCGSCHAEGAEWQHAGHADEQADPWSHYDWTQPNRASCRMCHSGNGFIDFSEGLASGDQSGEFRVLDCSVCHAAHGKPQSEDLLRVFDDVTLPGGVALADAGPNATCMTCHNGRRTPGGTSLTPHYLLGGVMLQGINAADFGATLSSSRHTTVATCVDCHMAASPTAPAPGAGKVGGHSFNMAVHDPDDPDYGFENVENACNASACHGDTGALTVFNRPAFGDFDGNGSIDGVQDEVEGLLNVVFAAIEGTGAVFLGSYPYWDLAGVDPALEQTVRDAIWNYEYVDNDGSLGVHNTDYAVGALQAAYEALTGAPLADAALRYTPAGFGETVVAITDVNGGAAVEPGGAFTVDFTVTDELSDPIDIGDLDRLQIYVSGPSFNYQRVIEVDNDVSHFAQNPDGSYTYTAVDPFPAVYAAPENDSPFYGPADGELTGLALVDGTYTVLIESRRVFGSIRKAGDATFDFVVANDPLSPPAPAARQVVTRDACNACHNDIQIHGNNRFAVTGCVVCHTAGGEDLITDPATTPGVTINLAEMIHKVHQGHSLPNVAATANGADPYRYEVIGHRESVHDFSDVGFPIIPEAAMDCEACHGGAAQGGQAYTAITRSHCSSCHDDIDFVAGTILDQTIPAVADGLLTEADLSDPTYRVAPGGISHIFPDDTTCVGCHGAGMFADAEVAHQHPTDPAQEGTNPAVEIVSVGGMSGGGGTFFQPGDFFQVTFKLMDDTANPLEIIPGDGSTLDRMEVIIAGPTSLYQTIIPAQRPWNNSALGVAPANWIDNFAVDGTYTFISEDPWPADYPAQLNTIGEPPAEQIFSYDGGWGQQYTAGGSPLDNGTYSVVVYGRRTTPTDGEREPYLTDVFDVAFGAGGAIVPYAGTVDTASCNACHGRLAFHGFQRYGVESCLACHTAGTQDGGTYESVDLRIMVHKLHNARNLTNLPYEMAGHGGLTDFSHLLISSMPGEAAECHECHVNDDWKTPPVRSNMRTWMVACTSCHDSAGTAAHVDATTLAGTFTETCVTCHGVGAAYSVEAVHATP